MREFGTIGFLISAIAEIVLALLYLVFSAWNKSWLGRIIAGALSSIGLIFFWTILNISGHPLPNRDLVRVLLYWPMALSLSACVFSFVWVQLFGRNSVKMNIDEKRPS